MAPLPNNWKLLLQGTLLCFFTCIRTATPTLFYFVLPFLADCVPRLPHISLISAVASTARLASCLLVALFPSDCMAILTVLSGLACLAGIGSEAYPWIPTYYKGYWVFVSSAIILFCSGSSLTRSLIVTEESPEDLHWLSVAYTASKESTYALSFLLSTLMLQNTCWNGFGMWVVVSFGLTFVACITIMILRQRSLVWQSIFQLSNSRDSIDSLEDDEAPGAGPGSSLSKQGIKRTLSKSIRDFREVSGAMWIFIQAAESINVVLGVTALSGVMLVKDQWDLGVVQASYFTLLPMAIALPVFLLTTIIKCDGYLKLTFSIFLSSVVVIIPFVNNLYAIGFAIFITEFSNAVRLAEMTPLMNHFMPKKQTTIRMVSIVSFFTFTYKTIGLSIGSWLYITWAPLPFVASGIFQIINGVLLFLLRKFYWNHLYSADSVGMESKGLLN